MSQPFAQMCRYIFIIFILSVVFLVDTHSAYACTCSQMQDPLDPSGLTCVANSQYATSQRACPPESWDTSATCTPCSVAVVCGTCDSGGGDNGDEESGGGGDNGDEGSGGGGDNGDEGSGGNIGDRDNPETQLCHEINFGAAGGCSGDLYEDTDNMWKQGNTCEKTREGHTPACEPGFLLVGDYRPGGDPVCMCKTQLSDIYPCGMNLQPGNPIPQCSGICANGQPCMMFGDNMQNLVCGCLPSLYYWDLYSSTPQSIDSPSFAPEVDLDPDEEDVEEEYIDRTSTDRTTDTLDAQETSVMGCRNVSGAGCVGTCAAGARCSPYAGSCICTADTETCGIQAGQCGGTCADPRRVCLTSTSSNQDCYCSMGTSDCNPPNGSCPEGENCQFNGVGWACYIDFSEYGGCEIVVRDNDAESCEGIEIPDDKGILTPACPEDYSCSPNFLPDNPDTCHCVHNSQIPPQQQSAPDIPLPSLPPPLVPSSPHPSFTPPPPTPSLPPPLVPSSPHPSFTPPPPTPSLPLPPLLPSTPLFAPTPPTPVRQFFDFQQPSPPTPSPANLPIPVSIPTPPPTRPIPSPSLFPTPPPPPPPVPDLRKTTPCLPGEMLLQTVEGNDVCCRGNSCRDPSETPALPSQNNVIPSETEPPRPSAPELPASTPPTPNDLLSRITQPVVNALNPVANVFSSIISGIGSFLWGP